MNQQQTTNSSEGGGFDPLSEIKEIVRDAIRDGLIKESMSDFKAKTKRLQGAELEAYLQELWDKV